MVKRKDILIALLKGLIAGAETSALGKIVATFVAELASMSKDKEEALEALPEEKFDELLTQSKLATTNAASAAAGTEQIKEKIDELSERFDELLSASIKKDERVSNNIPYLSIGNVKGDVTISQDQSGGTTAHETGTATGKKHSKFVWSIITAIFVVASIATILTYFDVKPIKENKMPKGEEEKISIGDVNGDVVISQDQSGGITAGKIGQINILTDKESLGIREPEGLYQNGKKVGRVVNFVANEKEAIFTMTSIEFDQPLRDSGVVWQPYEYQNYTIQIKHINSLVTMMPPGAEGVSGVILNKK